MSVVEYRLISGEFISCAAGIQTRQPICAVLRLETVLHLMSVPVPAVLALGRIAIRFIN